MPKKGSHKDMNRHRLTLHVLLVTGLLAVALSAYPLPALAEARKAIQFQFNDLDGHPVRLADFRGKWVLVNFWAYWCPLCRIGIPTLNELNERDDLVVIGVSLDYGDNVDNVRDAVEDEGLHYQAQVAGGSRRDPNSPYRQVGPVDYFPTSYLYDPTGEIVMFIPGQIRKNQLLAFMDSWRTQTAGAVVKPTYAMDLRKFESALTRRFGSAGSEAFRQWRTLREKLATASDTEKLAQVNDYFNKRVRHIDDRKAWGQRDYWATPSETLGAGRGDSEDNAIAKYFTLLSVDIPVDRLRLVYTHLGDSRKRKEPVHMVLAYYATPESDPLVLDDHTGEIRPASQRPELRPVYSFNSQHIYVQTETSTYNQPPWQQILQRARAEGFE
jgi:predicted transglutaminase-like cysteine proteinase/cytochrome oxidase Cu insertion factor (SCO1/SenC/PrrC family)